MQGYFLFHFYCNFFFYNYNFQPKLQILHYQNPNLRYSSVTSKLKSLLYHYSSQSPTKDKILLLSTRKNMLVNNITPPKKKGIYNNTLLSNCILPHLHFITKFKMIINVMSLYARISNGHLLLSLQLLGSIFLFDNFCFGSHPTLHSN